MKNINADFVEKVYIDPYAQILYASYYIYGLYLKFGKEKVRFSKRKFRKAPIYGRRSYDQLFAIIIKYKSGDERKYIIDFGDRSRIIEEAYYWSDVYAKINFNPLDGDAYKDKIKIIAPSFGIRLWSKWGYFYYSISNFIKVIGRAPIGFRTFLGNYKGCFVRESLKSYLKYTFKKKNYIFFTSTICIFNALFMRPNR